MKISEIKHLEQELKGILKEAGVDHHPEFIHQIMLSALALTKDQADRGDIKLINSALKELRYAFKVFRPYEQIRKVTIFGSARTPKSSPTYKQAVKFAKAMVKKKHMVITGAASGIMEAGNVGAGREHSFGVNIRLPFEQSANIVVEGDPKLINFRYFFTRKLIFVKETNAVVLFPGGFGTQDEGFELLTLVQTGKSALIPIVMLEEPGGSYWKGWQRFVEKEMLQTGMISAEDLALYKITDSVAEAVKEIEQFYKVYHSMRFVGKELVIRMNKPLSKKKIDSLNHQFRDLLISGEFRETSALSDEQDEVDLLSKPRLVFHFVRSHFGLLRQLIDEINKS